MTDKIEQVSGELQYHQTAEEKLREQLKTSEDNNKQLIDAGIELECILNKNCEELDSIAEEYAKVEKSQVENKKMVDRYISANEILKVRNRQVIEDLKAQHHMELKIARLAALKKITETEKQLVKGKRIFY